MKIKRRYPIGAEVIEKKGVHFRVWAPDHENVTLVLKRGSHWNEYPMDSEKEGYFSLLVSNTSEGSIYGFKVSDSKDLYADPASRYQPEGPNGPSCVINPSYKWTDNEWRGVKLENQIIYEMHIGTFTKEGTFKSAIAQLPELAKLGITLIEIMPINDFAGLFGWGYDGVNFYAPYHLYGTPDNLKEFINKAHELGLGVILDVVYNHLGSEGDQMSNFAKRYLSNIHGTHWGKAINFDLLPVREYFLTNAKYWIEEFHFDGLRIDATPSFFCSTPKHILSELTKVIKKTEGTRKKLVIGENEPQNVKLLHSYKNNGHGFDALWNDDFHHNVCVRLTGKREAYYTDYLGSPQEFISLFKYGFLYQGQYYEWQKKSRGKPDLKISPERLITFLENHDQVANTGLGERVHQTSEPGNYRAMTCLFLLGPNTPMLFQGQEFGSSKPFYYFADHRGFLKHLIKKSRKDELAQFPRLATPEIRKNLPNPSKRETFLKCKLNFKEREKNHKLYRFYKDLISLRRNDKVFKKANRIKIDGAVLGEDSFLIRYFGEKSGDRLIIINFGSDHSFNPEPEPLLVAGENLEWEILLSSESVIYGGFGTPPINVPHWKILGHSAIVLKTVKIKKKKK